MAEKQEEPRAAEQEDLLARCQQRLDIIRIIGSSEAWAALYAEDVAALLFMTQRLLWSLRIIIREAELNANPSCVSKVKEVRDA